MIAALFALLFFQAPPADRLPKFEDFPVKEKFTGKPAAPILRSSSQREFRTAIRDGSKEAPNLAGRFRLVSWGCGSGCLSSVVVDERSGEVYDLPLGALTFDAFPPDIEPIATRADSRLVVIHGCPNEKDCASYYYEWTGSELKMLRKLPVIAQRAK